MHVAPGLTSLGQLAPTVQSAGQVLYIYVIISVYMRSSCHRPATFRHMPKTETVDNLNHSDHRIQAEEH